MVGIGFLKSGFGGGGAPGQQILVIVGPVFHHGAGEAAAHDIIHVLLKERSQNLFDLLREVEGTQFCRIGETVHHVGDATMFECFGDGFPTVLDKFGGISGINAPR